MVLSGEYHAFHARFFGGVGPFPGSNLTGLKVVCRFSRIRCNRLNMARGVRAHHAPLAIRAPVHEETEFQGPAAASFSCTSGSAGLMYSAEKLFLGPEREGGACQVNRRQ